MLIGLCTKLDNIEKVKEIGYDYIELSGNEIMSLSDEQFYDFADRKKRLDFRVEGFNAYCNAKTPMVGDLFCEKTVQAYAAKICERGAVLGFRFLDIGAPAARMLPDGYNRVKADNQCKKFLEITAKEAQKHNIEVLFEALHNQCCNYLHYSKEALKLVQEVNMDNLKINLDFYHMEIMQENFEDAIPIMPYVRHLHYNHISPGKLDREYIIPEDKPVLQQIKRIIDAGSYDGTFSVEPDDTPAFERLATVSYQVMREIFGK